MLAEDIQNAAHSLADIFEQFLDRFTLGVASRQSRNFRPEPTCWTFVDDHGVSRHAFTFAQWTKTASYFFLPPTLSTSVPSQRPSPCEVYFPILVQSSRVIPLRS